MHARLLLRAVVASSARQAGEAGRAQSSVPHQLVSLRNTATNVVADPVKASGSACGGRTGSKRRFVLYPAAAAVALTSVAAAKAHQQSSVHEDDQHSPLLDSVWVQQIPQQQNVLQVLSAKSIDSHPLLKGDHIVSQVLLPPAG